MSKYRITKDGLGEYRIQEELFDFYENEVKAYWGQPPWLKINAFLTFEKAEKILLDQLAKEKDIARINRLRNEIVIVKEYNVDP